MNIQQLILFLHTSNKNLKLKKYHSQYHQKCEILRDKFDKRWARPVQRKLRKLRAKELMLLNYGVGEDS